MNSEQGSARESVTLRRHHLTADISGRWVPLQVGLVWEIPIKFGEIEVHFDAVVFVGNRPREVRGGTDPDIARPVVVFILTGSGLQDPLAVTKVTRNPVQITEIAT